MPNYRFSSLSADGALISSSTREAESDEEAQEIASELLMQSQCDAVEVWCVWRMVHRTVRDPSHTVPLVNPTGSEHEPVPHHRRH
jgi:hypothetical protein